MYSVRVPRPSLNAGREIFMLSPARIHGSCHRLQKKLRDKLGQTTFEGGEVLILLGKWCARRDSNARPSAEDSDSRASCFQQLRKSLKNDCSYVAYCA